MLFKFEIHQNKDNFIFISDNEIQKNKTKLPIHSFPSFMETIWFCI